MGDMAGAGDDPDLRVRIGNAERIRLADVEDTVYACRSCGAELIRTSVRRTTDAKPAAA